MKITKRQLRRIIKEENARLLRESGRHDPDSGYDELRQDQDDEDIEREALLASVEDQLNEIITHVITEANRIGGDYRSPVIKKQVFDLMYNMIGSYKR